MQYYQIDLHDEDDDAEESESGRKGELRSEPSHSPWGMEYAIAKETGWRIHYIRWTLTWQQIQMMLADAPRLVKRSGKKIFKDDKELMDYLNGVSTSLNDRK